MAEREFERRLAEIRLREQLHSAEGDTGVNTAIDVNLFDT
jgi:hypothetical protein